jgi:hypothetical protein
MRHFASAALIAFALGGAACVEANEMKPPERRSTDQPPPRDGNIAIQEELDAARRAGTVAAYDLFIARHPDHKLADIARRERARIAR